MRNLVLCSTLMFGLAAVACEDESPQDEDDSSQGNSSDTNEDESESQSESEEEIDTVVQESCAEGCVNQSLCIPNFLIIWETIDNCVEACMRNPEEPVMACSSICEKGINCDSWIVCTADCAGLK